MRPSPVKSAGRRIITSDPSAENRLATGNEPSSAWSRMITSLGAAS